MIGVSHHLNQYSQDNDTCNGLTNGQAAYGIYDLLDTYGTVDFTQLREALFASGRSKAEKVPRLIS